MKDKSRFMSSVIVSLLAGFIYFMFDDINENVQSSIKAVLSSNDIEEQYITADCLPFKSVSDNSGIKTKKKKSKFYIKKRNTIEFQNKDITIPGDELFSDYIANNQAKFQKPTPDKNIDFTAELDQLIKNDGSKSGEKTIKDLLSKSKNEIADSRSYERKSELLNKNFEQTQTKSYLKYRKGNADYKGNGFEYNYITGETSSQSGSNSNGIKDTTPKNGKKDDCKNYNVEYKKSTKIINGKKIKIYTPKADVDINNESGEIEINDDSENEDSCN